MITRKHPKLNPARLQNAKAFAIQVITETKETIRIARLIGNAIIERKQTK